MALKGAYINLSIDNLSTKLRNGGPKAFAYLDKTTRYYALVTEMRAKTDARWRDQTGNARSGLTAQAFSSGSSASGGEFAIVLFHRVPYGIWLESRVFSHKGDLGVIRPTIDRVSPDYQQAANQIFQRMFS